MNFFIIFRSLYLSNAIFVVVQFSEKVFKNPDFQEEWRNANLNFKNSELINCKEKIRSPGGLLKYGVD